MPVHPRSSPWSPFTCVLLALAGALASCGGKTSDGGAATEGGVDAGAPDVSIDAPAIDSSIDAAPGVDAPIEVDDPSCAKATSAVGALVHDKYCTTLVRVSSIDTSILGWSIECGPLKIATDADARAAFSPYAGPYTPASSYTRIGPTGATDDFVFFHAPSDFGGLAVVSLALDRLLFAGELSWSAFGSIRYPSSFRPASEAPQICAPYPLGRTTAVTPDGAPADPDEVAAVVRAVERSPIPRGVGGTQSLAGTLVVYFPIDGAVSTGGAPKNEWLVVIDSALAR